MIFFSKADLLPNSKVILAGKLSLERGRALPAKATQLHFLESRSSAHFHRELSAKRTG